MSGANGKCQLTIIFIDLEYNLRLAKILEKLLRPPKTIPKAQGHFLLG